MGEPKAFASLSSGLLARKGAARPAMRPQGFGQIGGNGLEDLGWNDMGFEAPKPADGAEPDADHDAFGAEIQPLPIRNPLAGLTPVGSPVHDQQDEIEARFAADDDGEEYDEDYDDTAEVLENAEAEIAALSAAQPEEPVALVAEPVAVAVVPQPVAVAPRRAPKARSAPGSKAKAAFTLRLDKARHLKLRLACAVTGRSAQQLVTDALDALLATMPELDSMADGSAGSKN